MKFIKLIIAFFFTLFLGILTGILASLFGWAKIYTEVYKPAPQRTTGHIRDKYERSRAATYGESIGRGSMDDLLRRKDLNELNEASRIKINAVLIGEHLRSGTREKLLDVIYQENRKRVGFND